MALVVQGLEEPDFISTDVSSSVGSMLQKLLSSLLTF
jgi:hypothetical protein